MTTQLQGPVRVRFAPSPTGFLHVGGARTAIYNDFLRRQLGGQFILRIEDTDRARSDAAMTEQILSALRWLGVAWDEGPHFQSEGIERHRATAQRLLEEGKAYPCFLTQEFLAKKRDAARRQGGSYRYDRAWNGTAEEVERRIAAGEPYAIRFAMPTEPIRMHDLVAGDVEFPLDHLSDFIILRSDGTPTYHLSVVCDDIEMKVSHVVRGDDHLSNTPKHIGLFRALGYEPPTYCHLPLILGADKKRLSKRTGAASVEEFREQGILHHALYNYLALLGWSPGDDRELMSRDELVEAFTVERLVRSASVFDPDKLAWMNAQYMSSLPFDDLLAELEPFLAEAGLAEADPRRLRTVLELHRGRARDLRILAQSAKPYFQEQLDYDLELCKKHLKQADLPEQLERLAARYAEVEPFDIASTDAALRAVAEELGLGAGKLIHPTRMALSGAKAGPPLFDLVEVMGREASLRHLANFGAWLRANPIQPEG